MAARPTVILTRPLPEALHWQQLLQARGLDAAVLPLLDIAPAADPPYAGNGRSACLRGSTASRGID